MTPHWKNPLLWFNGLLAGFLGGFVTALAAVLGVKAAQGLGWDVLIFDLKQLGIVFAAGGVATAVANLEARSFGPVISVKPPAMGDV